MMENQQEKLEPISERRICMKISIPTASIMHEYLLVYGEEWIIVRYNITGDEIDDILYGAALPTPERQHRKITRAKKEDSVTVAYINEMYKNDHFIWDEPQKKHIRCANAAEDPIVILSDEFLERWLKMYLSLMDWDTKKNENHMKPHGWSLGERVINKTTSLTTDDDIHERMIRYLECGVMLGSKEVLKSQLRHDHVSGIEGHNIENEDFLEDSDSEILTSNPLNISKIGCYDCDYS